MLAVVVSEEHCWLFVGIYDGFNGPDAPEFLICHLYHAVYNELKGLFWEVDETERTNPSTSRIVFPGVAVHYSHAKQSIWTPEVMFIFCGCEDIRRVD
ncbi:hypothetical protein K1719_004173 [Acacia pycnantha]|nr:hypothetical protein K1719_004173 [Acacia pycnantha]